MIRSPANHSIDNGNSDLFIKRMMARQKGVEKRSLPLVNEHFEHLFNAASAALGINQSFLQPLGCLVVMYRSVVQKYKATAMV